MPSTRKTTVARKAFPARKPVEKKIVKKSTKTSPRLTRNSKSESVQSLTPANTQMSQITMYLKNPRLWVGVGVVVVAGLLFIYKGLFVAAVVNGEPISRFAVISSLEKQSGKQALDNLVVENLVMQEAQKRNITVSQSDIDAQIQKIETQLKGQGMTLSDALAARGMTQSDLVDQLKIQGLLSKMVGASIKVTDADVATYISQNQDSLPKNLSDSQLKSQVRSQLEQQALQDKTQTFVASLQKNAKISYFVNY